MSTGTVLTCLASRSVFSQSDWDCAPAERKYLELRVEMSLSRLWQQGKKAEAHQLLAEIYIWFTEGFDTKDLQEAKALLQELT